MKRVLAVGCLTAAVTGVGAGIATATASAAPAVPETAAPALPALPRHDVASRQENDRALAAFGTQVGIATTVGGLAGTALGAGIGCVVTLPAGCVAGAVTGAGIGGVVGTIVAGGPTLIVSGIQLAETLNAAPGTSPYADPVYSTQP
nr:hypothetical protein [Rhodococcus rhodnii]